MKLTEEVELDARRSSMNSRERPGPKAESREKQAEFEESSREKATGKTPSTMSPTVTSPRFPTSERVQDFEADAVG